VEVGTRLEAGEQLGFVKEGLFNHWIMVPFQLEGVLTIENMVAAGKYTLNDVLAVARDEKGDLQQLTMVFNWPVKRAIKKYAERLKPEETLITKLRIIDTFIPVAKGGTYCIPGPFGAGKTVLQQITSRYADADIIIIAACGERAGEVVETLKEFPELIDPKTGRSLMERTIIICNTSSMPVAAREASVYTAVTMAEYYRQMGLNVLLLADSTSRWAQAMREMSGRLEEIPGEEAFPAYLESLIAAFYERAGIVRLKSGDIGSVTIGGTVSPAGGNFEEPVTQATLKVVGAFHGLSQQRADARKYPAIHPLESWSKYKGIIDQQKTEYGRAILFKGDEVGQMMKVVGEEGTSLDDYIIYLKSELLDYVYIQQNSFDPVDAAVEPERQLHIYDILIDILTARLDFAGKEEARSWFNRVRQNFLDYNGKKWKSNEFNNLEKTISELLADKKIGVEADAESLMAGESRRG
jgi:V/A-type H+/Na+-transporting ATPase subunit A